MDWPSRETFELLERARHYPALLARLSRATGGLDSRDVVEATLEGAVDSDGPVELFRRYLEKGELAAARKFLQLEGADPEHPEDDGWQEELRRQIMSRAAHWQKQLKRKRRHVRGLLLLLESVEHPEIRPTRRAVEQLCEDEQLAGDRPGWVIDQLEEHERRLESIIDTTRESLQQEYTSLREVSGAGKSKDFDLAMNRLERALESRESLPTAQKMLELAGRAAEGKLSQEDLTRLHRRETESGRIVRPWSEFASLETSRARDVAEQLQRRDLSEVTFGNEREREHAVRLFERLSFQGKKLDTRQAVRAITAFLDLDVDTKLVNRTGIGSVFAFEFKVPRVPAFRSEQLWLAIPYRPGRGAMSKLVKQIPDEGITFVYHPGRLGKTIHDEYGSRGRVPHFDNLDLLRLCEVSHGRREQAFQQIVLPRAPYSTVNPWQLGGPVAGEMFRGRKKIIDRLSQPRGGTVLFSGRMMGKSSILDRMHRQIESDRSGGSNRRSIRISNAGVDLFRSLIDELAELLPDEQSTLRQKAKRLEVNSQMSPQKRRDISADRREMIVNSVRDFLRKEEAHLTILIDEADKFAKHDARRPIDESLAWALRDLEFDHPESLRVVFAGFQTIHEQIISENGAFANWFGPEEVSSLDQDDARKLIREPFADFGYAFTSEAGLDRILEFTGRHPLLLQEFANRLMKRMKTRRTGSIEDEVMTIEAGDVETVTQDDELRERVHQVLSLNLNEYRRLKLMVYLILESCGGGGGERHLKIDSFRLDDLKATLTQWYGDKFNDYFDDRNIGALVSRLRALGLVEKRAEGYEFANRTYARMLMENPGFEEELEQLLAHVTNPAKGQPRRFATLPAEQLERISYEDSANILFIGLPKTLRTSVAQGLYKRREDQREAYVLSASGCQTKRDLRQSLKSNLGERRKTLTLADFLLKNDIETLVVDDADGLVDGPLREIADELNSRDLRLVALGGFRLARDFVDQLLVHDFKPVRLERLRAEDIQRWGREQVRQDETDGYGETFIIDEETSERLEEVTSGYFPLILRFKEYVRGELQRAREYFPEASHVEGFARDILTEEVVRDDLLAPLSPTARQVLGELYRAAGEDDHWTVEPEWLDQVWMPRLTETAGVSQMNVHDILDVLELVDLVNFTNTPVNGTLALKPDGPLARAFVD